MNFLFFLIVGFGMWIIINVIIYHVCLIKLDKTQNCEQIDPVYSYISIGLCVVALITLYNLVWI